MAEIGTTETHRHLMFLLEELVNFLNREKIQCWIDWGTMLGYLRHGNVIPWDYDCDLCAMSDQYDKLLETFKKLSETNEEKEENEYKVGRLLCLPDAYKDDGCLWIKDANYPDSHLGIDVIRYKLIPNSLKEGDIGESGTIVKHCMNEVTCRDYPCEFGGYDFLYNDIFPLKTGFLVGLPILFPNKIEELSRRNYGDKFMEFYPYEEYLKWLLSSSFPNSNSSLSPSLSPSLNPSLSSSQTILSSLTISNIDPKDYPNKDKFLKSPFKSIKEFKTLAQGLAYIKARATNEGASQSEAEPFIVRQCPEFLDVTSGSDIVNRFKKETNVLSWHETETELFNDTYHEGAKLYEDWLLDQLKYNIVDAPSKHLDLLPQELLANLENMGNMKSVVTEPVTEKVTESVTETVTETLSATGKAIDYAICYAMTKKNNLTKYHQDLLGDGWVYLDCGQKVWHIFDVKDLEYLEKHGYSLFSIKDMNFTELVTILDGYMWSKIHVAIMGPKDFIYFPESWPHRVITYDKSFGICGYTKIF